MRLFQLAALAVALGAAWPAAAQQTPASAPPPAAGGNYATAVPKDFSFTGGATLTSDYRFRGLTQSDENPALQATVTVNHVSGFYAGAWASTIDGGLDGSTPQRTGYGSAEVDLYGGFAKTLSSGIGLDAGLLYYLYPDHAKGVNTDFFEPYASISYTIGPVAAKLGGAYAWGGQKGLDFSAGSDDNLYVYGELSGSVPATPLTLKAHLGHTSGALGLVNPSAADRDYWDWSLNAEAVVRRHFKLGVSYVDTDISERAFGGTPGHHFAQGLGRGATLLGYVGVSF